MYFFIIMFLSVINVMTNKYTTVLQHCGLQAYY